MASTAAFPTIGRLPPRYTRTFGDVTAAYAFTAPCSATAFENARSTSLSASSACFAGLSGAAGAGVAPAAGGFAAAPAAGGFAVPAAGAGVAPAAGGFAVLPAAGFAALAPV